MLFRMKSIWIAGVAVALSAGCCGAQTACSKADEAAKVVHRRQADLMKAKVEEMDTDVAPALQLLIHGFKDALAGAVAAEMTCAPTGESAAAIQAHLAKRLTANLPEKPFQPSAAKPDATSNAPVYDDDVYGDDLKVAVSTPTNAAELRIIQMSFGIQCGEDTMLLIYTASPGGWQEALRWRSPDYKEVNDAFGDFFLTAILPGSSGGGWRAVAAHGKPWCTSRFSGFSIDVLAPSAKPDQPRVVWHTDRGYSRGDFVPRLRGTGSTFELRLHDDEMIFDMDDAFERLVIYRYGISGDKVTRIEPIAGNARGFLEEWLSMPWEEAVAQSDSAQADELKAIHTRYETSYKDADQYTSWHSGPVRACAAAKQFQVEVDSTKEMIVPGVPGGRSEKLPSTYFRLRETADGYRLLSAGVKSDPSCSGPDLMKKK